MLIKNNQRRIRILILALLTAISANACGSNSNEGGSGTGENSRGRAYIGHAESGSVSVIDTTTDSVIETIDVRYGAFGVAVNYSATKAYFISIGGVISILDTYTNHVIDTLFLTGHNICLTSAGTRIYVAGTYGEMYVIDTSTSKIIEIPLGGIVHANGIAIDQAGSKVYVTRHNEVVLIDTSTNNIAATINLGDRQYYSGGVAVSSTGIVYAAGYQSHFSGYVFVIDASNSIIAVIDVGSYPEGIAVNPDGTRVYVANSGSDTVSVINTSTNTVIDVVNVGKSPRSISVNSSGTKVYVANFSSNSVSVIDASSNSVTKTIIVGNKPMAFGNFIK